MTTQIKRMWINQPSSLQSLHVLHGTNVMVPIESKWLGHMPEYVTAYFLSGTTISVFIRTELLSEGWLGDGNNATWPIAGSYK